MTMTGTASVLDDRICSERVYRRHGSWKGSRCTKPAVCTRQVMESVKVAEAYIDRGAVYEGGEPERVPAKFENKMVAKPFCATHDPERKAKRAAEKSAERKRERERDERITASYTSLQAAFKRLGFRAGIDFSRHFGYATGITFDSSEAQKLLDALKGGS